MSGVRLDLWQFALSFFRSDGPSVGWKALKNSGLFQRNLGPLTNLLGVEKVAEYVNTL